LEGSNPEPVLILSLYFFGGTEDNDKNLRHNNLSLGLDSNRISPEYESNSLPLTKHFSVE
jgi:hypothetical protein